MNTDLYNIDFLLSIPEVAYLKDFPAGSLREHPEGNAWNHTKLVIERVIKLTGGDPICMLAAALHDTGKAHTPKENYPNFPGHYRISAEIAEKVCDRLGLSKEDKNFVCICCHYHHTVHRCNEMGDKGFRRLFEKLNWNLFYITNMLMVCQADHQGRAIEIEPYPQGQYIINKFFELRKNNEISN